VSSMCIFLRILTVFITLALALLSFSTFFKGPTLCVMEAVLTTPKRCD
jgi:hypothetical protein